jgi:hypothetical protein
MHGDFGHAVAREWPTVAPLADRLEGPRAWTDVVALRWLAAGTAPDYRSIARFRKTPPCGVGAPVRAGAEPVPGRRDNNYDSFGALSAAEIGWAWVASDRLPEGLTRRLRTR